ncbi:MAG TPA: DNA polymerase III subunit gamma/tau, partial [Alistipes putredinis]|nr:DNA polymerase III subunit gamma/tau [Alistipes putredinis]
KTLEEPPAHAIFILATTEKHKIIPTILSRCQIYDFNRIRVEDSVEYLKYIAS